jgi:7,8-dihydroneopterin aldolase/epimerase/oxygenase
MDRIELIGMEFYGFHGVFAEEQALGQRFTVDAILTYPLQDAGKSDSLDLTVNYADVYARVKEIVEGPPKKLLESVAESIADALFEQFPVHAVEIRVVKEHPPIPGVIRQVAVRIQRQREGNGA